MRLVEGLADKDVANVYKALSATHPFTQKLALDMGFQGKKDKDAAKHLKKVIDRIINAEEEDSEKATKRRKIIEVIVSNMYEESPGFKKKIDDLIRYVCNVTSEGEVTVRTHKRGHKAQEKTWRRTQINENIEKDTSKERGEKSKKKYGELGSKEFGTRL